MGGKILQIIVNEWIGYTENIFIISFEARAKQNYDSDFHKAKRTYCINY